MPSRKSKTRKPVSTPGQKRLAAAPNRREGIKGMRKRTDAEIERDMVVIGDMLLEGKSCRDMAAWIAANRPYTLSIPILARECHRVMEEWRSQLEATRDLWLAKVTQTYNRILNKAMAGFEDSRRQKRKATTKASGTGSDQSVETSITTEESPGDAAFLAVARAATRDVADLLGLGAPKRVRIDDQTREVLEPLSGAPKVVLYIPDNGRLNPAHNVTAKVVTEKTTK